LHGESGSAGALLRFTGKPLRIFGGAESPDTNPEPSAASDKIGRYYVRRYTCKFQPLGKFICTILGRECGGLQRELSLSAVVTRTCAVTSSSLGRL
jgi:hypothetical protein